MLYFRLCYLTWIQVESLYHMMYEALQKFKESLISAWVLLFNCKLSISLRKICPVFLVTTSVPNPAFERMVRVPLRRLWFVKNPGMPSFWYKFATTFASVFTPIGHFVQDS